MAHGSVTRGASRHFLRAVVTGCALTFGLIGAAQGKKAPPTPAEARAELLKKLSPAEIMQVGDEAARAGDYERAITVYNQAIEAAPSADLWYRVAWIYARLGKKQVAADAYVMTLQYDPRHAMAHEELGLLYLENKQRDKAAEHLRMAVEADSGRWRSHNVLGVLADTSGDYSAALAHYQAALAVNPDSAQVLNNLGYSHYLAGNLDQAEQSYQRALILEPGNRAARVNMGLLHARRGDYARAVEVMGAAMDKAKAHNDIGYVALQNGDMEAAERLFREAIRLSPSYYETAHENLARVIRARSDEAQSRTENTPAEKAPSVAAR
jgi:Tfp pilus assembly protein PilF